ncbi:MAG: hypothetical protein HKO71_06930, partial [Pseudomonadales bacterium]|nr:hypothetical protein [Pseudomonadales bacterium]
MISNPVGFLFSARKQWQQVAQLPDNQLTTKLLYPIILGLGPPVAWFYGSTQVGWTVGDGDVVKLTQD